MPQNTSGGGGKKNEGKYPDKFTNLTEIDWKPPYSSIELAVLIFNNGAWGPGSTAAPASRASVEEFMDIAYAVMVAESGGNPQAKNPNSSAAGLFQIMQSVHGDKIAKSIKRYPSLVRELGMKVPDGYQPTIFDPIVNVDVARQVWNEAGKSWKPWVAYTAQTPAYKAARGHGKEMYNYLNLVEESKLGQAYGQLAGAIFGMSPTGAVLRGSEAISNSDIAGRVLGFAKSAGVTIGAFLLGVILLILGIWFVMSQTGAGRTAKRAVKKAVPLA